MVKLYLVRHAQSESNTGVHTGRETVLTKTGIEQAKRLGLAFRKKNLDIIYCSKLIRAKDTLKEITPYLSGVRIKYTPKINEISRGVYEHKPEEFKRALKESGEIEAVFRPPKGENYFDLEKRAQRFLEFLEKIHKNDSVLIVSHGLFLRLFLLRIFGLKMKEGQYFELHNAGLSFIEFKDGKVVKCEIDDHKHLLLHSSYPRDQTK